MYSINLIILLILALPLLAQDTKPLATVEELSVKVTAQQKEIDKLKLDNSKVLKLLNIYQQEYFKCEATLIAQKTFSEEKAK